ncbi:MAG: hypothetical protein ACYC4K_03870 [Thiobacillus sp.]
MSINPTFQGEMQLAGWSDSHTGGRKVTFWLPEDSDLETFKGLTARKGNTSGHRFMAVLVEIGDDEMPVEPVIRDEQNPIPRKAAISGGGALAKWAGILSNDPKFWEWLELIEGPTVVNANQAAEHIRLLCGVSSRADLDHDAEAGRRFREEFMAPFDEWTKSL